ncbi:Dabb family protein [Aliiglaciecola sp. LCG003]|uniref:Dabb family protein n=1 Tax=Aliiglaciecola sp. LCG003 TaxID=3053655 RepID=UPI0025739A40|nr:Dabb family protein [Aliiglaciecola sp. LCG003]WJG10680.1 Dabb family protein [Aliiglaciecola sp. LCG003]
MAHLNRRQFITTAAVLGVGATASIASAEVISSEPKLVHSVYFWLKNPGSTNDRDALIAGLKTLKQIPTVKSMQIGLPATTEKRDVVDNSFDVFELMYFDDTAGQSAYQVHPLHLKFVENCSHLWDKVVVHDSLIL